MIQHSTSPHHPQIETARCLIRPAQMDDLACLESAVSDPEFPRRLPLYQMYLKAELATWLERLCQFSGSDTARLWSIDLKTGAACIGQIALVPRPDAHDFALSFWLAPSHWGQGLASEALCAFLDFAFHQNNLQQVWAGAALWNDASTSLLKKLGFAQTYMNLNGYRIEAEAQVTLEFTLPRTLWQSRAQMH